MIHLVCNKCYDSYITDKIVFHQECLKKFNVGGVFDVVLQEVPSTEVRLIRDIKASRWVLDKVFFKDDKLVFIKDKKIIAVEDILPKEGYYSMLIELDLDRYFKDTSK